MWGFAEQSPSKQMAVGSSFLTRGGEGAPATHNKAANDEQLAHANANQVHLASELQKERAGRTGGQVCTYIHMYVCMYVYIYIYYVMYPLTIYIYVYTYTYIYIYIHTYTYMYCIMYPLTREGQRQGGLYAKARHLLSHMRTYAHVCGRMRTSADVF